MPQPTEWPTLNLPFSLFYTFSAICFLYQWSNLQSMFVLVHAKGDGGIKSQSYWLGKNIRMTWIFLYFEHNRQQLRWHTAHSFSQYNQFFSRLPFVILLLSTKCKICTMKYTSNQMKNLRICRQAMQEISFEICFASWLLLLRPSNSPAPSEC